MRSVHTLVRPSLVLPLVLLACASPDAPAPDVPVDPATRYVERGPHAAGFQVLQHDGRTVKAWYPSDGDASAAITYDVVLQLPGFPPDPVGISGIAVADGPVAPGTHPLAVLSHGFSLNPEWYHGLAEHLASHGFVVLAPEHVESDWMADVVQATADRPADVRATLDLADATPWIDGERVAVVGHSYGGYTALAAAGARLHPADLEQRCAGVSDPMTLAMFCEPLLAGQDVLAEHLGLGDPPAGLWPSLGDARVDAVVAIAGDAYPFGPDGLAEVEVPAMLLGGTADTGTPWEWGAQLAHDHVSSDRRALVALEGAEHMIATAPCEDMPFTQGLPPEYRPYFCEDPAWDKGEGLDVLHHMTTAWLLHTLVGDERAREALDPSAYADDPRLTVSVEL